MLVLESRDSLYPYCYSVSLFLKLFQPNIAIEYTADPSFGDEINQVIVGGLRCLTLFEWLGEINKREASSRAA